MIKGLLNTSKGEIKADGLIWTYFWIVLNLSNKFWYTLSLKYCKKRKKKRMNKARCSVMKLKGDDTWKFLMHSLPKRMQGHISSVTLLGELWRKSRLGITFMSCSLIFSRYFLFSTARKFCTGSTLWTSKWGPVSSRSTRWGWNRSVLHQSSWAAGGLAFQAENLEKWKGSPYLVGTRVADEN